MSMTTVYTWLYVALAVGIALSANTLSTIWAGKEDKFSLWLLAVILISPFVFITFGLVTARVGLVVSSATIDSLLTIGTILIGLFIFKEWDTLTIYHYSGIILTIMGIMLLHVKE